MRRRDYPGWRMVWALAATETISYGVLYYAFAAFLPAMQRSLAYSQTTLAGAFSLSVLVTGAGAIPAGVWLDRHGARALMTAGSVLAAGSVLLWAQVDSILALYLTFTGMGLAGTAVLYEPAYATVNAYFDTQRQNALLALTMVAGLASTIFVPASSLLIIHLGWRHALIVLGHRRRRDDRSPLPARAATARRPGLATRRGCPGRDRLRAFSPPGSYTRLVKSSRRGSHADPSRPAIPARGLCHRGRRPGQRGHRRGRYLPAELPAPGRLLPGGGGDSNRGAGRPASRRARGAYRVRSPRSDAMAMALMLAAGAAR